MSLLNGTSHVSAREFTIRTGSDGYEQNGRIHTPDPAAVANLKRILAQQAATGRSQAQPRRSKAAPKSRGGQKDHVAAILEKAKEKKRPSAQMEPQPEKPKIEDKMKPKNHKQLIAETFTEAVCRELHEKYYVGQGKSVQWIAKNNEYLAVTTSTMTKHFRKYGLSYKKTPDGGWGRDRSKEGIIAEPAKKRPLPKPAAKAPPVEPARPEPAEMETAVKPVPPETAVSPGEKALAVVDSSNGRAVATADQPVPHIDEQMVSLRRLLAELPRGKGIKIHGKISIELEF